MTSQGTTRRLVFALGTLAVVALCCALVGADEILRLSYHVPGDSKPIVLYADEIATWTEGTGRIVLLKGRVLAEHGVLHTRAQQAVAWVDQEKFRRTGILYVDLYAEGEVVLESGPDSRAGPGALVNLSTRGEIKLKSHLGKVIQQPQPADPLYQRAQAVRSPAPTVTSPIQRTSAQVPAPAPLPVMPPVPGPPPAPAPRATPPNPVLPPPPPLPPPQPSPPPPPAAAPKAKDSVQRTAAQEAIAATVPATPPAARPVQGMPATPTPVPQAPPGWMPSPSPSPGPQQIEPPPVVPNPAPPPLPPGAPAPGGPQGGPPPPGSATAPGPTAQPGIPVMPTIPTPVPPAAEPPPPRPPTSTGPTSALDGPLRQFSVQPRSAADFEIQDYPMPNGEHAIVVAGGVILNVRTSNGAGMLDIEADRMVLWTRDNPQQMLGNLRRPEGQTARELEFYLSGNVEIRAQSGPAARILRAREVYYDVRRNVAVAMQADLESKQPGLPDPIHLKAEELQQLSPTYFRAVQAEVYSSRLPSDPGLKVYTTDATLDERQVPKRSIFGRQVVDRETGQPETEQQRIFRGRNIFLEIEDVPVFYLPFLQGDANDPLGPLQNVSIGHDRVFGTRAMFTWNVYDLLGIDPVPGTRWRLETDYLSRRGPALGTTYDYAGKDLFTIPNRYNGVVKANGIYDTGTDILGGGRGEDDDHPEWRGRFLWRQNIFEMPQGFTFQSQVSVLSDKNYLEQYFKTEFDTDINQETFGYLKQQQDNWAWTLLGKPRIRNWVTETEWLPRADGYLIGQSFFDIFTYNVHGSAGYAQLKVTDVPPPPVANAPGGITTDQDVSTGRFDLMQDLSLPFYLGPVKVVPYGVLDLTAYTEDLTGNQRGRIYGGGGVRSSIPFTRLYPSIGSELFNINGINHKIVLSGNYYNVGSDTPFTQLPQLDRLDDDATDQARRDIVPNEPLYNAANGIFLATSPLYNLQTYAIRRLVTSRADTLDTIEEFEANLRQRWQTKRGYPGQQHIVDWMTLDLSGSFFPNPERDNFGSSVAFLEYDWIWNIGDRTALTSSGWTDPIDYQGAKGPTVWTVGLFTNRPDRTTLSLSYRQVDILDSQLVIGSATYIFSPKYAITASTAYDFGMNQSQSNQLVLTRMGSDLQVSVGVSYDGLQDNFGVRLEIVPNLALTGSRVAGVPSFGSSLLAR